jgi:hypothetical protein
MFRFFTIRETEKKDEKKEDGKKAGDQKKEAAKESRGSDAKDSKDRERDRRRRSSSSSSDGDRRYRYFGRYMPGRKGFVLGEAPFAGVRKRSWSFQLAAFLSPKKINAFSIGSIEQ